MLTHDFDDMLTPLLDFNINLMKYKTVNLTSHFLNNLCLNSFFPYINIPKRHTSRSKTLIDNTLHNGITGITVSENITTNISIPNHFLPST